MEIEFQQHIKSNHTDLLNKTVLLAVSGGIDSVVLLHLCCQMGMKVAIAHCNFHLREEESNGDQFFVEHLATVLNVPCHIVHFETEKYAYDNKVSIQIAARELRYKWFYELLEQEGYTYLLTGHHLDDSIETFLINFSRGTGLEGLLGIPEQTDKLIRPLLPFSRSQILEYANEHKIEWREDRTNAQTKYLRNKIRKLVLPILKEINPQWGQSFIETISHLKDSFELSQDAAGYMYKKVVSEIGTTLRIDLKALKALRNPKAYLYQWLQPYGFKAWDDIATLIYAQAGKTVYAEKYVLLKDRDYLFVRELGNTNDLDNVYFLNEEEELYEPIGIKTISVGEQENIVSKTIIYVDKDSLTFPLQIRKVRTGDYFYPLGMNGSKKVSKFFKDEKFSLFDKEDTWLLCSQDKIVWIIGSRMDERFKIKNTTINILKIQITQ
ncbi:MAG: tRNA lysidine(34) synthetase TilS [Flavobacteriaceae bacterium]|jgi:tRNA(Ile)-lysidine synthase|nr:tRNA lysidine(34) synthetase TilS [Flavobacteriaceae bacterium]